MAILLALLAAVAYGVADYVGGVVAQRSSPWQVATVSSLTAALATVPLVLLEPGTAHRSADWLLAAIGGLGSGCGSIFLYRGLATARMSVVAPLSAVAAALIPVALGLGFGERPGLLAVIGIACALPAIALIAGAGDAHASTESSSPRRSGVADGLLSGAGFGVLFAASGRINEAAGLAPTLLLQLMSLVGIVVLSTALGQSWLPRGGGAWRAWIVGPLVAAAIVLVMLASREGLLSIVAVIASLYPAVTVLLAAVLLSERIDRRQAIGLALAAGAVALVASGGA